MIAMYRAKNAFHAKFCLIVATLILSTAASSSWADEERWSALKQAYFGDAEIVSGDSIVSLDAPKRAHDAATVPISVKALDSGRTIRELYLFVDQNPLPLAGIFRFTEEAGYWNSLETRIRINEYTDVRAVAVLANGELHMSQRFVKASGGCSAPALADMDAAMARAGKMKLLLSEINDGDSLPSSEAVIKISHPNNSGMQFDQVSRNYIPAFYVNTIKAQLDGVDVLSVETNFSMSENPVVRVSFRPDVHASELKVVAIDSKGNTYSKSAESIVQ
ncbi:MAG: quinoprotein dehydrogenase-associated SoxYZ-like carrier [Granulosicoccus sp.]